MRAEARHRALARTLPSFSIRVLKLQLFEVRERLARAALDAAPHLAQSTLLVEESASRPCTSASAAGDLGIAESRAPTSLEPAPSRRAQHSPQIVAVTNRNDALGRPTARNLTDLATSPRSLGRSAITMKRRTAHRHSPGLSDLLVSLPERHVQSS